ncbi:MAG: filamentous hemagglutinin N-terminal domain-containing protein [Nostocaceae cyanobacterium]|nr:filamentous hemagglutinin N-terminal domain-containing protein [Nostocaceae cyanobacterium]
MKPNWYNWHFRFSMTAIALSGIAVTFPNIGAFAQIVPDDTLGHENSVVTPINGQIDRLDGGAIRGSNLFHSFREFNIDVGKAAYFDNPAAIENIFTRVTGSNPSRLFGTLGVLGDANLFFLNPNGIIFGKNAQLDIQGSFFASTASSIIFPGDKEFSATNPQAPPLLTVEVQPPIGLQFEGKQPTEIINQGNLVAGQNLTLSGSNLNLSGQVQAGGDLTLQATDTLKVRDSVENPFIAATGGKLLVQGNKNINIFTLNHPSSGLFSGGDMVLRSANPVLGDAHYWSGGNFQIQQLNGDLGELYSESDPIIRSLGDVSFFGYFGASLHVLAGGSVDINAAIITGADTTGNTINPQTTPELANVTLSDGNSLVIDGSTQPTLDIRAGMTPEAIGIPLGTSKDAGTFFNSSIVPENPPANNPVATSADITVGDVRFDAPNGNVLLTNQYQPNTSLPSGDIRITQDGFDGIGIFGNTGGNVSNAILDARGNITLDGSVIFTDSEIGNGGDITLLAKGNINLNSGSQIGSLGLLAGNINLKSDANISLTNNSILSLNLSTVAGTKGGDINITANSLSAKDGSRIINRTRGQGNTGNVIINASDRVSFDTESFVDSGVLPGREGTGGDISITTGSLSVINGAYLDSSSFGIGDSGNVIINARDTISFDGVGTNGISSQIRSGLALQAQGQAGDITITTGSLSVTNGAVLDALSSGIGDAGNVTINARDTISFDGVGSNGIASTIFSSLVPEGQGQGGDITITTGSLFVTNGANFNASNFAFGNPGKVKITARDTVSFDGVGMTDDSSPPSGVSAIVNQGAQGSKSGGIEITTGSLSIKNGARVLTNTLGTADGGDVEINARDTVFLDRGSIYSSPGFDRNTEVSVPADGNGGDIKITTGSLVLTNDSNLSTSTFGNGRGGDIQVNARDKISVSGGSGFSSVTTGSGNAGNIEITAGNTVSFDGVGVTQRVDLSPIGVERISGGGEVSSGINSSVSRISEFGRVARGKGGDIRITTGSLFVTNGASLSSFTTGEGDSADAGNIIIRANDLVSFDGNSLANTSVTSVLILDDGTTERFAVTGDGGDIDIQARSLSVTNGARLATTTLGAGKAGDILVNTTESVTVSGVSPATNNSNDNTEPRISLLITGTGSVDANATGEGGNIDIKTGVLKISEGAALSARSSRSSGKAGDIAVNVNELELTAGGKISTTTRSTGVAGNITVNATDKITISGIDPRVESPESGLFADSLSSDTTSAGNITVNSPLLLMDNQGRITTQNTSSNGGNINLDLEDLLLLRNHSLISTTAGTAQAGGNGGNIKIDTQFIVAFPSENSDITANAFTGNGGRIQIQATGIFGIEPRLRLTPFSDITASSIFGVNGIVEINTPGIDPNQGLTKLPEEPEKVEFASGCQAGGKEKMAFFNIGRGGLPPSPNQTLPSENIIAPWVPLVNQEHKGANQELLQSSTTAENGNRTSLKPLCQEK